MRSAVFLLPCLCSVGALGQTAGRLEFEVASVRPSSPPDPRGVTAGCRGGPGTNDPGLFSCSHMTLGNLVGLAYQIDSRRLSAPDWLADTRYVFDLQARVPQGTTKDEFSIMVQNLLADRFKLTIHRDTRDAQHYDLVVAKGGPKFKAAAPAGPAAIPPPGSAALEKTGCPALPVARGVTVINGEFVLHIPDWSMDVLATQLAYSLDAPVMDATGLTGKYDIAMCWAADDKRGAPNAAPTIADSAPTLQQAVRDQLGLRLESKKGPVEFIVVDHAEKLPAEN